MNTVSREEALRLQAKAMPEKELLALVTEAAKALGWRCYHTYRSDHSEAGFPDLCMARRGVVFFAELKTEKGNLRPEQADWLRELDPFWDRPGEYVNPAVFLWRPSDWLSGEITRVLQ